MLWIIWAAMLGTLALYAIVPTLVPPRATPWYEAQIAVGRFVAGLLALVAGVGTFAIRETLALKQIRMGTIDPTTPAGHARIRVALIATWALCDLVGILGLALAIAAGNPALVAPFAGAAAVLFLIHRPQDRYFERPSPGAAI